MSTQQAENPDVMNELISRLERIYPNSVWSMDRDGDLSGKIDENTDIVFLKPKGFTTLEDVGVYYKFLDGSNINLDLTDTNQGIEEIRGSLARERNGQELGAFFSHEEAGRILNHPWTPPNTEDPKIIYTAWRAEVLRKLPPHVAELVTSKEARLKLAMLHPDAKEKPKTPLSDKLGFDPKNAVARALRKGEISFGDNS